MGRTQKSAAMQKNYHPTSLLRWFFLVWLGCIYLWELILASTATITVCITANYGKCLATSQIAHVALPSIVSVTFLMLLSGGLLWMSLEQKARRFSRFFFVIQGLVILALGFVVPGEGAMVALSLSLALILAASIIFEQIRPVIAVACGYCVVWMIQFVLAIVPKPGIITWNALVQTLLLEGAPLLFGIGYLLLYKQLAGAYAQLEVTHRDLAASVEQIEALTRLTERQRLARELHDTLAQGLSGIVILVQGAHLHLTQKRYSRAEQIMRQSAQFARETLGTARVAIDNLYNPVASPEEFVDAIQEDIQRFTIMTGIACLPEKLGLLAQLSAPWSEAVRRMINEGLSNVARHAQAQRVWVRVLQDGPELTIEIQDDGIGFDPLGVAHPGHYGLLGLQERARLLAGHLEIASVPGQGTLLRLRILQGTYEVQHG